MPRSLPQAVCLLLLVALTSCSSLAQFGASTIGAEPTLTPTAFAPSPPTPTRAVIHLWLPPSVPQELRRTIAEVLQSTDGGVMLVHEAEAADVSLEAGSEALSAEWVYALVAPFPTVADGMALVDLQQLWARGPLLATEDTALVLSARLGEPGPGAVQLLDGAALLDAAWAARPSTAIVPFEDLDPRWKVLELDGLSPVRRDFTPLAYGLTVRFSLRGPHEAVGTVREVLAPAAGPDGVLTNRDPGRLTTVVMTGVTALTRGTAWRMETRGIDYPGLLIGDWLRQADLTHTSNEVAFAEDCPPGDPNQTSLRFCSPPAGLALLEQVGIDVIELTGNHILDWGRQAFLETLGMYQVRGLAYFGGGVDLEEAYRPFLFTHNGNRLALLGCNAAGPEGAWARVDRPGAARCDPDRIASAIGLLRAQGYLTIFTFQWSESYRPAPLPGQVAGFQAAVDAGAVIVSGSQAHRPQGFEFFRGGLIHYGLGNLFFDQMWSEPTRQELIDRHVFYDGRYISTEILTAYLEDYAQPRPMTADERAELLSEIFSASRW